MPTGNVTTTHIDGGLGLSRFIADRIHAKIGEAETGNELEPKLIMNSTQAKQIFGRGPLVDSLVQHFEEFDGSLGQVAAPVVAVRPKNDVAGSVADPVKAGSGTADLPTVSGQPTGTRNVILKFTVGGAHGVAEYRRSTDGGKSFESPILTPASGQPISLAVGVTADFQDSANPQETFAQGDMYTFAISGPTASVSSKIDAVETLKREYRAYWMHLVGAVDRSVAVSIVTILEDMKNDKHHPAFAVLEASSIGKENPTDSEIMDYLQSLDDEWDPFFHDRVCIVTAEGRYISGGILAAGGYSAVQDAGPIGEWRNAATMLCAKLAAIAPNHSAGHVAECRSLTFSEVRFWDRGMREYAEVLNDIGLTVLKEYDDYEGVFVARDNIKCSGDSDFQQIPERRLVDKIDRIVYQSSLPFLNSSTDAGQSALDALQAQVSKDVASAMMVPGKKEINGFKITLDPDGTFQSTGILKARMAIIHGNRMQQIEWTTSFERPQ